MIIALDENGKQINLFEMKTINEHLNVKKMGPFYCPVCKKAVRFKCGVQKIPHFAHIELEDCVNERKESKQHYEGKYDLYYFFNTENSKVYVEKYIQSINQRPDLLIEFGKEMLCIEYQCSKIPLQQLIDRSKSYKKMAYKVFWIFGKDLLQQRTNFSFSLSSLSIYCLGTFKLPTLCFYDPSIKTIKILSSLIAFSSNIFVGKKTSFEIEKCNLQQLLIPSKIHKSDFVKTWCRLKKAYRNSQHLNFNGSFYPLKEILYSLQIDYLPSVVGVPLNNNFLLNEHCIAWQGILYFTFIHSLKSGEIIIINDLNEFLHLQVDEKRWNVNSINNHEVINLENCVENYINFLVQFRIVKRTKNGKIMKIADAIIPKSFQHALDEDYLATSAAFDLLFHTELVQNNT